MVQAQAQALQQAPAPACNAPSCRAWARAVQRPLPPQGARRRRCHSRLLQPVGPCDQGGVLSRSNSCCRSAVGQSRSSTWQSVLLSSVFRCRCAFGCGRRGCGCVSKSPGSSRIRSRRSTAAQHCFCFHPLLLPLLASPVRHFFLPILARHHAQPALPRGRVAGELGIAMQALRHADTVRALLWSVDHALLPASARRAEQHAH